MNIFKLKLFCVVLTTQIILFQFGLGANAHYIILELYAQGNILLTDTEFTVLTLLRSHRCVSVMLDCLLASLNVFNSIQARLSISSHKCLLLSEF